MTCTHLPRVLLIVDVQNDFVEGGSLAVTGGTAVAEAITAYLRDHPGLYEAVIASRDFHDDHSTNGGHFAAAGEEPNFIDTWPRHCVAGTSGSDYAPGLDTSLITHHIRKGMGKPAYSMFQGVTDDGRTLQQVIEDLGVRQVDIVGIATDHCVRATALDARVATLYARVLVDLTAGVATQTTALALTEMVSAEVHLATAT